MPQRPQQPKQPNPLTMWTSWQDLGLPKKPVPAPVSPLMRMSMPPTDMNQAARDLIEMERRNQIWGTTAEPRPATPFQAAPTPSSVSLIEATNLPRHLLFGKTVWEANPYSADPRERMEAREEMFGAGMGLFGTLTQPAQRLGPVWYSALREALESKVPRKGQTGAQVLNILQNPKMGVKRDELFYTGLEDYLRQRGQNPVTYDELKQFLDANDIEINEVTRGMVPERTAELQEQYRPVLDQAEADLRQAVTNHLSGPNYKGTTRFSYGETEMTIDALMRDPTNAIANRPWLDTPEIREAAESIPRLRQHLQARVSQLEPVKWDWGRLNMPGEKTGSREMVLTLKPQPVELQVVPHPSSRSVPYFTLATPDGRYVTHTDGFTIPFFNSPDSAATEIPYFQRQMGAGFRSHGFPEPDIIAWIRFNERIDPRDGKRVLFIEEIQSDWHQKARDFREDEVDRLMLEEGLTDEEAQARVPADFAYKPRRGYIVTTQTGDHALSKAFPTYEEAQRYEVDFRTGPNSHPYQHKLPPYPIVGVTVPSKFRDVPFRSNWDELALKRVMKLASDEGFDRIAWTTGQQQIERYNTLTRSVADEIQWTPTATTVDVKGKSVPAVMLRVTKNGADLINQPVPIIGSTDIKVGGSTKEASLNELLGRQKAKEIRSTYKTNPQGETLSGGDLNIGGQGMMLAYDQKLKNFLNQYSKKFGGRVTPGEIAVEKGARTYQGPTLTPDEILARTRAPRMGMTEAEARKMAMEGRWISQSVRNGQSLSDAVRMWGGDDTAEALGGKFVEPEITTGVHSFDLPASLVKEQQLRGNKKFAWVPPFAAAGAVGLAAGQKESEAAAPPQKPNVPPPSAPPMAPVGATEMRRTTTPTPGPTDMNRTAEDLIDMERRSQIWGNAPAQPFQQAPTPASVNPLREMRADVVPALRKAVEITNPVRHALLGHLPGEEGVSPYSQDPEKRRLAYEELAGAGMGAFGTVTLSKEGLMRSFAQMQKYMRPEVAESLGDRIKGSIAKEFRELPSPAEWEAAAQAGMAKRGWYRRSGAAIKQFFGDDAEVFTGILAALSPRQLVKSNMQMAIRVYGEWVAAGKPQDVRPIRRVLKMVPGASMPTRRVNVIKAMRGQPLVDFTDPSSGAAYKIESFRRNLLGEMDYGTLDTWIAKFIAKSGSFFGNRARYLATDARVRQVAERMGWDVAEVQETVWSFIKTLIEKTPRTGTLREGLETITHELIAQDPDFAQVFTDPAIIRRLEQYDIRSTGKAGKGSAVEAPSEALTGRVEAADPRILPRIARRLQRGGIEPVGKVPKPSKRTRAALPAPPPPSAPPE